jgi:hypothetical protein
MTAHALRSLRSLRSAAGSAGASRFRTHSAKRFTASVFPTGSHVSSSRGGRFVMSTAGHGAIGSANNLIGRPS